MGMAVSSKKTIFQILNFELPQLTNTVNFMSKPSTHPLEDLQ